MGDQYFCISRIKTFIVQLCSCTALVSGLLSYIPACPECRGWWIVCQCHRHWDSLLHLLGLGDVILHSKTVYSVTITLSIFRQSTLIMKKYKNLSLLPGRGIQCKRVNRVRYFCAVLQLTFSHL